MSVNPVPQAPQETPTCPRHPDRVSYVSCQRCGQPACPDCQRPAAVGVQCVDCVREQAKTVRSARTIFGGAVTDGRPVVTMTIIGICVVVWIGQQVLPNLTRDILFVPALGATQPWRFLTAAFAHGSIMHIAFNMYALWFMGTYLEPLLGRARFIALYLISALSGSVVLLLMTPTPSPGGGCGAWCGGSLGASGAVFGLFGAFLVLQRRLGRDARGMYALIGINVVIGFVLPNIAWQAHLGGLVAGLACAAVIAYAGGQGPHSQAQRRSLLQWAGLAGITVLLIALAVARYATVPAAILG